MKYLLLKFLTGILQAKIMIINIINLTYRTKNYYDFIYYPLMHSQNGGNQ